MAAFTFSKEAKPQAEIGVFGGSGFYDFLDDAQEVKVETPYGSPSSVITIGTVAGKRVAFLPRHGRDHSLPPHKINYRANVWAFKSLGISRVICPCAAGSLQKHVSPAILFFAISMLIEPMVARIPFMMVLLPRTSARLIRIPRNYGN
jgi:5'-methylthioadenosine phosphorylase